jgi:transposase InsO family protein
VRKTVFWAVINKDIETEVRQCKICNIHKPKQQNEPLIMHDVLTRPWQIVGSDMFTWNNSEHLILVDSYSGWFEINTMTSTSSSAVIGKLKSHFARNGIPSTLCSDNGPQYSSHEFAKFADDWGFQHITSSPKFSQSNGLVERAVETAKGILNKAKSSNTDPYIALLNYRNTPRDCVLGSPAQRLMSRQLRGLLPIATKKLEPAHDNRQIARQLCKKRVQQKAYYDRNARAVPLPKLKEGDVVRINTGKRFEKLGTVTKKCPEPRSYVVKTDQGEYRRNRRDLLHVQEQDSAHQQPAAVTLEMTSTRSESPHVPDTVNPAASTTVDLQTNAPFAPLASPTPPSPVVRKNPLRTRNPPARLQDYVRT